MSLRDQHRPARLPTGDKVVLVFPTTHMAMAAEDLLRAAGVPLQVVPAPPRPQAACGLAIRLSVAEQERAVDLLSAGSVSWDVVG